MSSKASYNRARYEALQRKRRRPYSWGLWEQRWDYYWHGRPHWQTRREDERNAQEE